MFSIENIKLKTAKGDSIMNGNYIVYNKDTLKVVKTFDYFGRALNKFLKGHPNYTWINRTHPKNQDLLRKLVL
jgi:hypothetical protein